MKSKAYLTMMGQGGLPSESAVQEKPTINDVARVAGVSPATVDRVLNERAGVRSATIASVQNAVSELGYVRDVAAANLARSRTYQVLFILPETSNRFVVALQREIAEQNRQLTHRRTVLSSRVVSPFDAQALVEALDQLDKQNTDGVAVFGPASPEVNSAVQRARARGIAVVALVADLPGSQRDHFVGVDNVSAGRTAATLLARFMAGAGNVLVVTGSRHARDHVERLHGFNAVIESKYPDVKVVNSIEGLDDNEVVRELLPEVFERYPDITGIYSAAAGNGGLVRYLKDTNQSDAFVIVAHELTDTSREALRDGLFDAVISQDTGHLVRSATRLLQATIDKAPFDQKQERIRIDIYLSENIPAD